MDDAAGRTAYPIRTERLTLRFPEPRDVDPLTAYRNDPAVAALQDWELPYPRERAEELISAHEGRTDLVAGTGTQVSIELDGELIGDLFVGMHEHGGTAEIGFTLASAHHRKGYAREAAGAVITDLIERHGVHRIVAQLSPLNHPSARVLESLGMTFESFAPRSFWWRGTWDDNLLYALSDESWRAWRERPTRPPHQVRLVELTHENAWTYSRLRTHRSQERFVATVPASYADALFPEPEDGYPVSPVLRGIEADGEPAGFIMWSLTDHPGADGPYLWRYLIDRRHQGRGIGRRALSMWIDEVRDAGHSRIETSWVQASGGPEPFYLSLGFELTGEMDDDEAVARLSLREAPPT